MLDTLELTVDETGVIRTNIPAFSDRVLRTALKGFLAKPKAYKENYLQATFDQTFDGYSFLGQGDSLNQYDFDLLHSFVVSDITDPNDFPVDFQAFFREEWSQLNSFVRALEIRVLEKLGLDSLKTLYRNGIKHMVSCNYYPALETVSHSEKMRLSPHKDVSLFSAFLFGVDSGLQYRDRNNTEINAGSSDVILLFPGYFLELLTAGRVKAITHQVALPKTINQERYSFAFFSIPTPTVEINYGGFEGTGASYYHNYLSLF